MALVNLVGADAVGKLQSVIVVVLLVVFAVFIVATLKDADFDLVAPSHVPVGLESSRPWRSRSLPTSASPSSPTLPSRSPNPVRNVPLATYVALGIAGTLYILISIGVFGTMSVEEVIASRRHGVRRRSRAVAGRRRLHDDVDRGAARHGVVGERQFVRRRSITANLADSRQFPPFFGGTG